MSWKEAEAYCESLDGHLATITSDEEQAKLEELLTIGTKNAYWLGASDLNFDGNWQWITNEEFSYQNWVIGQPDRYLSTENSLMVYREVNPNNKGGSGFGQWNDLSPDGTCEGDGFFGLDNFGFICEWEEADSPVEIKNNMKNYALFSASTTENLSFYGWKSNISGNIYSGASFNYGGSELYVNGRIDAVGNINASGWKIEVNEQNENVESIEKLDFDEVIHDNAQPYEYYEESPAYIEDKTVISSSIKVSGDVVISSTSFEGDCYIIAEGNITYNVDSFNTAGRVFLYSRNGNITINGTQININGAMYAPNGQVKFNTNDTTLNGFVWADSINYGGSVLNVTSDNFDMVEPKCIVKTYTIDEDFNEGELNGLSLAVPNQLMLSEKQNAESVPYEKIFGDIENGKGVKVTCSADKSAVSGNGDSVNIRYGLSGFGEADVNENAVDLMLLIDESWSMQDYNRLAKAKEAAKEIVEQMKSTDRCAVVGFSCYIHDVQKFTSDKSELLKAIDSIRYDSGTDIANGLNYTLKQFDDSDRQKYIILLSDGEDSTDSASIAKQAGEKDVRIFAMMIGSGTLQMQNIAINSNGIYKNAPSSEDIGKIMSYFASEVFNVAGRNTTFRTTIKDKNSVDTSKITPAPSKITENENGSVTLEWSFDRITIDEQKSIDIPLTVNAENGGFSDLIENTSCVYYDRSGKPNIVYADDLSLPVSNYAESGSWSVVFDSEREAVNWKNIYWNGVRHGDGTITVNASASDDGANFSEPIAIKNYEDISGLTGRYVKIEVNMTISSDGRTPELYDITVMSEDAVMPEFSNAEPILEIASKSVTKVNVPLNIRADLSDDCLKSELSVKWSCDNKNVKFADDSKLMTSVICAKTGSYDIVCTVNDGEKTVQNMRTIVCEPADSYADIDPDKQDEAAAPKIKVALPKYAYRNEKINTKIEKLNDTEISWYSVIFNGNTAVNVDDEGNFALTMPNRDGTYKVVVRAFDWAGKSDVQEYEIIVDSIVPAVEIIPSSDEAIIGSEAFFKIKVTGEHKIKSVEYTLNGEKIDIPKNGIVPINTDKETEYILEAKGETIKGKEISASAKINVIEADTENPEVKITFDKSSYNENGTAVITVNATDNVGVTKLDVFVNGEAVTLDKDGKFKITGLKYGDYIISANAFDAAGNKGTASKTLTAKDVTKPTLELKADKTEVKVGEKVNISVIAADNNGVVSTELTINNKKVDLSEDNTAVFTPDKEGKYVVKATASDPSGNTITKQLTITAVQPDTIAPTVTLSFDKDTYFEDDDIVISVSATDNVGVTKTVLLVDGKEVELDKDGNYTVKKAELKDYEIIAKAYDEENNEGTATSTVKVNEAKAPEINVTFDKEMYVEGDSLEGLVTAQGQREIITLTGKVNGKPLAIEEGVFSLSDLSAGDYTFTFTAEDAKELKSTIEKKITVLKKDEADRRLIASIDGLVLYKTTALYKVTASDEIDKSTISATLNGEKIVLNKDLEYEFKAEKLFDNEFVLTAKTKDGETITVKNKVFVHETDKPTVTVKLSKDRDIQEHEDVTVTVTAEDISGIKKIQCLFDGIDMPLDENGQTVIRDFQMRPHALVVRAWDNFNNCRSYKISFYVVQYEVSGGNGSVSVGGDDEIEKELIADIYNPIDEDVITAPTDIFGRADGTDFEKYRLEYQSAAGGDYVLIDEGTKKKNNQSLGEFDPTMLRNGLYNLRLTVWGKSGISISDEILISVEG